MAKQIVVIVDSLTGLSRKFAEKLTYPVINIQDFNHELNELKEKNIGLFLVTRCHQFGEIPPSTLKFLEKYADFTIGSACGGNRNWGKNYGIAGDKIASIYNIPCITKFEATGFPKERESVKDFIKKFIESN